MSPADSSGTHGSRGRRLEVEISQDGRSLSRIRLRRSPATIGRGAEADVQLESGHVSRLHARVYFDDDGVTLVDAGSTNGFTVRGRRLKEAKITPGEAVDVAGFILVFRWSDPSASDSQPVPRDDRGSQAKAPAGDDWGSVVGASPDGPPPADDWASRVASPPQKRTLTDGWEEFEEDEPLAEPDTAIRKLAEVEAERPPPKPPVDPAIISGSILNRMTYQAATPAQAPAPTPRDPDDDDDEEPEEEAPPFDTRPMLLALNEEANAQSRANPYGRVAVEVIRVVNDEVRGVDVLFQGQSSWWGGEPSRLETLWLVAGAERFPMVTHTRLGEYRVQVPHDPSWKMFHRGSRPVDLYRSGPFVGCQAEFEDQVEISCGPFAAYVRCVKLAPPPPLQVRLSALLPGPQLIAAAAASLILHAGFVSLPMSGRRWNIVPSGKQDYFIALMRPDAVARDWPATVAVAKPTPTAPPTPPPPPKPEIKPPEPAKMPPLAAPAKRSGTDRTLRDRKAEPKPGTPEGTPPPPQAARPPLKSVSVADFKVSGFLDNLPTPEIDVGSRGGMRSGPAALRGAGPLSAGVVTKGPAGMRMTPAGRLTDAQVKAVVSQHAAEVEQCYNKSLEREPGLSGRVELEWVVDKIGVPNNVHPTYDDVGSPSLMKCLRGVVERWVFPPPKGGDTRVGFPFIFSNLRR